MDIKQTLGGFGASMLAGGTILFLIAPPGQWLTGGMIAGIGIAILITLLFTKTTDSVFTWVNSFKHEVHHSVDIDESKLKGSWSADGKRN